MAKTLTDHGTQRKATSHVEPDPLPDLAPGQVMDDFKLLRRIGQGAMGTVYLAQQQSLDRQVALKVLASGMTSSAEQVRRFRREIQNLARLQHPNIVTAFYAGVHADLHYVAMTYAEGEDLHHRLQRRGPLPEVEALSVLYKVGDALRYAWEEHGCIHRDIKPANIMIDVTGDIKLTDLGISRLVYEEDVETQAAHIFGTPHYMSPEQVRGELDIDFRADMYALGMTFYHMCCGYPAFDSDDVDYILECQRTVPLPPIEEDAPHLSLASRQIMQRLTAKHPGDRYDSWDTLLLAVQAALDAQPPVLLKMDRGEGLPAPPPGDRRPRLTRRLRWVLIMLAAIIISGEIARRPGEGRLVAWNRYATQAGTQLATGTTRLRTWFSTRLDAWHASRYAREEKQRVAEVLAHLDTRAREYLQAGQPERAAAVYTDYDGPWAEASFVARRERAEAFFSRTRPSRVDETNAENDAFPSNHLPTGPDTPPEANVE